MVLGIRYTRRFKNPDDQEIQPVQISGLFLLQSSTAKASESYRMKSTQKKRLGKSISMMTQYLFISRKLASVRNNRV